MKYQVSVFTPAGDRLIWASPVETLSEAARLARHAVSAGKRAFIRLPGGKAYEQRTLDIDMGEDEQ